jgi:transcription elongation factor
VISIEDTTITFLAIGVPSLTKPLEVDIEHVSKFFEPGDMVRIIEGKYKGDTGQVIESEDNKVSVVLDVT